MHNRVTPQLSNIQFTNLWGYTVEFLTKLEDILSIDDRKTIEVEVPEWNCKLRLRAMTGTDRDKFEAHVTAGGQEGSMNVIGMRAKLIAACIVDENGKRVLQDADEVKLGSKSAAVLDKLFTECMTLNGMSPEDEKKLVENFDSTQSEPSTSD